MEIIDLQGEEIQVEVDVEADLIHSQRIKNIKFQILVLILVLSSDQITFSKLSCMG